MTPDNRTAVATLETDEPSAQRVADLITESFPADDVAVSLVDNGAGRWRVAIHFRTAPDEATIRDLVEAAAGDAAKTLRFARVAATAVSSGSPSCATPPPMMMVAGSTARPIILMASATPAAKRSRAATAAGFPAASCPVAGFPAGGCCADGFPPAGSQVAGSTAGDSAVASTAPGSMAASLVRISSAARRVNVMARHDGPGVPCPATWLAIRRVSVRVLPVPGPATIISGLSASAAAC